jgi:hypothetical protein
VLLVAALSAVALLALSAVATGFVQVYSNSFNSKKNYRQIKSIGGGAKCERAFKEKRDVMEVELTEGPRACTFKAPVQGVQRKPDHRFDVKGRLTRDTQSAARRDAYLLTALRVGGGARYELRVFPKDKRFQLRRKPGGAGFPVGDPSGRIKGMGKLNRMALIAEGDRIRAIVNGTEVADVVDVSSNDVDGTRLEFGLGNLKSTKKDSVAHFDQISVGVPNP